MDLLILKLFLVLLITQCQSLELKLDREVVDTSGGRSLCGVLICSESTDTVVIDTDPSLSIGNISSMALYKIDRTLSGGQSKNVQRRLVAKLTLEQDHLIRVSNGIMISGRLSIEQATLRLEITKEKDCEAEFLCQVQGLDANAEREIVSSTRLVQQLKEDKCKGDNIDIEQILTLVKEFSASQGKVDKLEEKVMDQMTRLEAQINRTESNIESSLDEKHLAFKSNNQALKKEILTQLENKLVPLQDKVSDVSHNLTQSTESLETKIDDGLTSLQKDIRLQNELFIDNMTKVCSCTSNANDAEPCNIDDADKKDFTSPGTTLRPLSKPMPLSSDCDSTTRLNTNTLRPESCIKGMSAGSTSSYATVCPINQMSEYIGPYLCDSLTDGGGWIVIQRRFFGSVDFYRGWSEYKKGFGSLDTDFWLGNEQIHRYTTREKYELRVELRYKTQSKYAHYDSFSLSDETNGYSLNIGRYIIGGGALDSLHYHNGSKFSTKDRDNDGSQSLSCAEVYHGGWWYKSCEASNLNGPWQARNTIAMNWRTLSGYHSVTSSEMKIRRVD